MDIGRLESQSGFSRRVGTCLLFLCLSMAGGVFAAPPDSLPAWREPPVSIHRAWDKYGLIPIESQVISRKPPLAVLPDSLILDTLRFEYTKIKQFAYRKKLTRELYKLFFIHPPSGKLKVVHTQNSEERFRAFEGKRIGEIRIIVLPPYGTSVYDTTALRNDINWWKEVVNKTHMGTAESVIRRQLTFRKGSSVVPFELVQNEILLRDLDYIDDAVIEVTPVADQPDAVRVTVICKDELSWGGSVETNFLHSFKIGVSNKNFFKLGHLIHYEFSYRGTEEKKCGNILEYKAGNLWGTHIDIRGYYRNDYREKQLRVDLERRFLTARMRWAGGVAAGRVYYSDDLPDRNMSRLTELFNYHFQDVWLGYSFRRRAFAGYNRNLYLAGRFFTTFFNNRPLVSGDTNHLYYNRINTFYSLVYTKLKYYKANLIYDFGRTEDIPTGLYLGLTGGFEWSEYSDYAYLSGEMRYSHFNRNTERYYAFRAALGSYVNVRRFERGMLELGAQHISPLFSVGSLRCRFYNDARYIRGIRRYPADHLYMEDRDIRGFSSDTLRGSQKLALSLAATAFLPFIKKGFRTSLSAFVDAGLLAPDDRRLFRTRPYWGVGVAINLRNDNLIIRNIAFRFTFYPVIPSDGRRMQTILSDNLRGKFYDYRVAKPQALLYE